MSQQAHREALDAPEAASDLVRLVEAEDRIARTLSEAQASAELILRDAREAEREAERRMEDEIHRDLEALRARIEDESARRIDTINGEAAERTKSLEGVEGVTLESLASKVVARLIGTEQEEASGENDDHQDVESAHSGPP